MPNSQNYKPTFILIGLNIAIYIYTSIIGGNFLTTNYEVILNFGQVNGLILYQGYWWQLFTSMFIHVSIVHLAGNMLFLLIFGLRAEEMFSLPEYIGVYILGGLTGNLLSLVFMPLSVPSAGASGAIFGMFGAVIVYIRRSSGQSIIGALIFGFFLLLLSSGENVNNLAHIGGLVAGLLIGYLLASTRTPEIRYRVNYSYGSPIGYGKVRTSILTFWPSFNPKCLRRKTGAIISRTDIS